MSEKTEAPAAVHAVRGSEEFIAAASGDASEEALTIDNRQGLGDPLRILRLHWGISAADLAQAGRWS
jgi:hypothetical protein